MYDLFHNVFSLAIISLFVIILVIFAGVIFYSLKKIKELKTLEDLCKVKDNFKGRFSDYQDSFINYQDKQKTPESIQKFLNFDFLSSLINLRIWFWIPSLFVGLGILGTFYGLQEGITGFDTNTSDTIQESISSLLEGTSTAFLSSLTGIALSLVFHLVEKMSINRLLCQISLKGREFDERYLLKNFQIKEIEAQKRKAEQEFVVNAINSKLDSLLIARNHEGHNVSAIHYLANIDNVAKKNQSVMQEVIDDFYINIEKMFSKYSDESKSKIDDVISSVTAVNSALGNFSNSTGKEIGDTVAMVIENLTEQLSTISSDFKETLQEGALKQINDISKMLASTATIMEKTPQNIESTINTIQNSLLDELNRNIGNFREALEISMEKYTENVEKVIGKISQSEEELQANQAKFLDQSISKFEEREDLQAKNIEDILTTYSDINNEQLKQTSKVMKTSLDDFRNQFGSILNSYKTESNIIMGKNIELIKEIDRVVVDTKENTKIIHQDIARIAELNKDAVSLFSGLIDNNENLLSQFKAQISGLISITTNFKNINEEYTKTSSENSKILDLIKTVTEESEEKFKEYLETGMQTIELFKNITSAERENIINQVENYKKIHSEVEGVFEVVNKGINDYQRVTGVQINKALGSFTSNFDNAISGLSNTVRDLRETLESLEEIADSKLELVVNGEASV